MIEAKELSSNSENHQEGTDNKPCSLQIQIIRAIYAQQYAELRNPLITLDNLIKVNFFLNKIR